MKRFTLRRILLFALGAAVLVWMVIAADPHVLWQNISAVGWWLLLPVAVWGAGYLLNAASWAVIIHALGVPSGTRSDGQAWVLPSYGKICQLTVSGYAVNYITPFGLLGGEPYRIWALRPFVGSERAAGSVLLYLMMHVCSHFFFWLFASFAALAFLNLSTSVRWGVCGVAAVMAVLVPLFFRGYRRGMVQSFFRAAGRLPLASKKVSRWAESHREQWIRIDANITTLLLHHRRAFWMSLGLEFLSRLVNCGETVILLLLLAPESFTSASGLQGPLLASLFIVAFSSLFANLLFFSPLQMGTREGGIFLAMQALWPRVAAAALMPIAVSVSVLTRLREFVWIAVGLLWAFLARNRRKQ